MLELWTDGGVIQVNPSPVGLVWSWVLIEDGKLSACDWGKLTPEEIGMPTCSNNNAELYAAVRGLEYMEDCSAFTWYTDSQVTIRRLTERTKMKGVPEWLALRTKALRRDWNVVLVAGHPTKAELKAGKANRNGHMVSKWNKLVDELCGRAKG